MNKFAVIALLLLIFGCATSKKTTRQEALVDGVTEKMVEASIDVSAKQIQSELEILAKLAQQDAIVNNRVSFQLPPDGNSVLNNPFPMIWNGPLEPAMLTIAQSMGWKFETTGKSPAQAIIVQINSKEDPAFKIIESCGYQAGRYVALIANENIGVLKIVYLPQREG